MKYFLGLILCVLFLACGNIDGIFGSTLPYEQKSSPMPSGRPISQPLLYQDFCDKYKGECDINSSQEVLPSEEMSVVQDFRDSMDKDFHWTHEEVGSWDLILVDGKDGEGDCEDFALTLRSRLRKQYPEYGAAFRMATVYFIEYAGTSRYHAVLTVETDKGTYICDNRSSYCEPWTDFWYSMRYRELPNSDKWERLGPEIK